MKSNNCQLSNCGGGVVVDKMAQPNSINVLAHLTKRQSGDNIEHFRTNLFQDRLKVAKNLYKKDLVSHYGCVNAIEFSTEGEYLVSGGDDRRVLLWHMEQSMMDKQAPVAMQKQHLSNIFCLGLDSNNTRIFSGGNDDVVIVHDVKSGEAVDVFLHNKPVYGLSIDPTNDDIFATAGEDGRILIFDLRDSSDVMCVSKCRSPFHAVMHHPYDAGFIITANAKEGAALWDLRSPKMPTVRYGGDDAAQSCMSVRFNNLGTQVLALRRRLPPILFPTVSPEPICQFYHPDYYNSCTMKSCCFAGEHDQYVLSGSDDFNLYVWRVTDADAQETDQWVDSNQMVLYGHRSIVNQVRFNSQKCLIASSGVEKIIKLWSPFELDQFSGSLTEEAQGPDNPREVFTNEEYISLNMTHDYSHQSTTEDPRMMAFFDYLVQQEIEGWNSETSDQTSEHSSDENESSRPDTTQTSDTESVQNYIPIRGQRETRRGDVAQRTKYRNRIAYLIATKRNRLKRLALKSANVRTNRRLNKTKYGHRNQTKRTAIASRTNRKGIGKRIRRLSTNKYSKRPVSHEQTSDSEVPKTSKKRRLQPNLNTALYRSFRRKSKGTPSSTSNTSTRVEDSSSDDDDDADDDAHQIKKPKIINENLSNLPSTSKSFNGASTSANLDMPSTSTGITANGKSQLFRTAVVSNDEDSEDEPVILEKPTSQDNMVRVITSPINEYFETPASSSTAPINLDHNENVVTNNNNTSNINNNNNSNHKRNNNNTNDNNESSSSYNQTYDHTYSSRSNSRLSSSYQDDDYDCSSSNDSFVDYFKNMKNIIKNNNNAPSSSTSANKSENGSSYNRELLNCTPDSGVLTGPCSSAGSSTNGVPSNSIYSTEKAASSPMVLNNQNNNNSGDISVKIFQQKIARVRKNYRKHFCDDSDSE